jgi:hypothetical protein
MIHRPFKLPFDPLSQNYTKPKLYLCEVDKTKICELETSEMSGSFKFNAYSELTSTVPRAYTNMVTGETDVNPFYDKIEALRLFYLENFGYFEIQDPEITSDGIREVKNLTAYSLEYTLSQKYLEGIKINQGTGDSEEVIYAKEVWGDAYLDHVEPITLYNSNKRLSLVNLIFEKVYGWSFVVEDSLKDIVREFEISRVSVYDFIMQDICDKFNCFAVFDTINNIVYLYAENYSTKFYGDGYYDDDNKYKGTTIFNLPTPYGSIGSVTLDGYRTKDYSYSLNEDGKVDTIVFAEPPADRVLIEITDGAQEKWDTDIYISFDNLAQEINIDYSAEDIKTVLTVRGSDDLGIENVNMGLSYIVDLSYYYSVDWMGQELYDAYTAYNKDFNKDQKIYASNVLEINKLYRKLTYLEGRLSLEYVPVSNVKEDTVGTYYVKVGDEVSFYYQEVKLPAEWRYGVTYYSVEDTALHEEKFADLFDAILVYYKSGNDKDISELNKIKEEFNFVESDTTSLINNLKVANDDASKEKAIVVFLNVILDQLGYDILNNPYKAYCNRRKESVDEAEVKVATIFIDAIDNEMSDRLPEINELKALKKEKESENEKIAENASIDTYFYNYYFNDGYSKDEAKAKANALMIRLSPFLREDEYTDDNFVVTDLDDDETELKVQKELLECGRVELSRLCEPRLSFSMEMANIYALQEFQPLVHNFQLGNLINVAIRDNYIKKARILGVDINFDDFSDFTCEFGELTSVKTPSSIHADLLSSALTAAKSVASNASYWQKGADKVDSIEAKINQGLLGAINGLYTSDQSVTIDDNGIWLRKVNDDGSFSPYQMCLTSNNILMSTDGFKKGSTPKMGVGEFKIGDETFYGVLADAVLSGYIGGSTIVGGTINIGDGKFIVDQNGNVTINAANNIVGYVTTEELLDTEEVLSARIAVNADSISSKVNRGDFGTLVEQNYDHVKIAWNNNSKYIAFEDGALNIYNSSTHSNDTLLMKQNYQGAWYYYDGYAVGKIGTNHITDHSDVRGLCFNLESDGDYMSWSCKESASDPEYTLKMVYYSPNNNYGENEGVHFYTNTYFSNPLYLQGNSIYANNNSRLRLTTSSTPRSNDILELFYSNSSGSYTSGGGAAISALQTSGSATRFACYSDRYVFYESSNNRIDCYNHIYMNNYDIYDADISTASDIRLKTNINDTQINALQTLNQIEMKEFDWIESGKHEDVGMIAQQLQPILPDLIAEDLETGKLSIKMNKFIPYLIKAIQELYVMVGGEENLIPTAIKDYDYNTKENFVKTLKSLRCNADAGHVADQSMSVAKSTKIPI